MPASCLTRGFNNHRTGCNLQETTLTPDGVRSRGIRHLFDINIPGDARGVEAQPLVVPGLVMVDGLQRDVLFAATMNNDVIAYDVSPDVVTEKVLWLQHLANPVLSNRQADVWGIADRWGILSTPVIDPVDGVIYAVTMSSPDGTFGHTDFQLHEMRLTDGRQESKPLDLSTATYAPGHGLPVQVFGKVARKQRPGLLLDRRNGRTTVFIAFGSFNEDADTNQGWVLACDVTDGVMSVAAAWTSTARYPGGGIWMAGGGLAMDDDGCVLGMTGNGGFDGVTDFGECFFKLKYTPRTGGVPARLECVDWFSPYSDTGLEGFDPTLADVSLSPGAAEPKSDAASNMNSSYDTDLGSGAPAYFAKEATGYGKDAIIGAGKLGIGYVVDAGQMGRTQLASFAPGRIQREVYGALLSPPIALTFDGVGIDCAPTDLSKHNPMPFGYTQHLHSQVIPFVSNDHGPMILLNGENGPVRAFKFNADYTLTYLGCGAEIASEGMAAPGGMPGGCATVSANGKSDGILWVTQPVRDDANKRIVAGRLIAYAANWFVNGSMVRLWSSEEWNVPLVHNKFCPPIAINGRVYVSTYDAKISVFGP